LRPSDPRFFLDRRGSPVTANRFLGLCFASWRWAGKVVNALSEVKYAATYSILLGPGKQETPP
jgi:hypothetical protein